MASTAERLGIVETKVINLDEKLDELKINVKDMHDCLDNTRDLLAEKLKAMAEESDKQHAELAGKISAMEKLKDKWTYATMGGVVVIGWLSAHTDRILSILK
jgi:dsDNA-specific endonuclease/ATPase MutS2